MYELPVLNSPSPEPEQTPLLAGKSTRFYVEGMHCASCVSQVEAGLRQVPGVVDARVNLASREATVITADGAATPEWGPVLEGIGYRYLPIDEAASRVARTPASPLPWISCAGLSVLVMLLCMTSLRFVGWQAVLIASSAAVVFGFGRGFFVGALARLRQGSSDMNTLIALGSGIAWLAGTWDMIAGHGHHAGMHLDAAVMIITFVLLGRWLEDRARGQASSAIDELIQLAPNEAVVVRAGREQTVALSHVRLGDVVLLRPGSRVPVDGTILSGQADFEESMLTGESMPVPKGVGDSVSAGTLCHGGSVTLTAQRVGDATTLQKIVGLVRDAQGTKAPIAKLADRVASIFVPIILGIAAVTALAWLVLGPADTQVELAIQAAVSVLVIACPCALGLATPTAVMVAMGQAAKQGLLIRDGAALETLGKLTIIAFDKTGTLTQGQPRVSALSVDGTLTQREALGVAAALARLSEHPLSRAITEFAARQGAVPQPLPLEEFRSLPGRGLSAFIGHRRIELAREESTSHTSPPVTRTALLVDGVTQARFDFIDALRPSAQSAIRQLHELGVKTVLLTGDRVDVARAVADQIGIDQVEARLLPEQKLQFLRTAQQAGALVGMVGDGINDAPALAQADIGFALGSGTDIAISAADVTVMHGDLLGVARAVALSRATLRTIRQNLGFAFGYNLLGVPLAAGVLYPWTGWLLPPFFAAAAMSLSSVSVVLNSLRLRRNS
jgi:heavy metal translocating P-type ATPase